MSEIGNSPRPRTEEMTAKPAVRTDYARVSRQLSPVIDTCRRAEFPQCVQLLLSNSTEFFPALRVATNPILAILEQLDSCDVEFVVQEYSGFSNASVHMLFEARIRNHWPSLRKEILRNLDEEMGLLINSIPHLELMRCGYRIELDIETDGLEYSPVTADFLEKMHRLFRHRDNGYLAGVLLAFEGVAVEEFRIVERLLDCRQQLLGVTLPDGSLTSRYVAGHVSVGASAQDGDPELDHFKGMIDAVGADARDVDLEPLARGFLAVAFELNRWWEELALETLHRRVRRQIAPRHSSPHELYSALASAL
jgi:Domain of Unknown Function with PDB structure (DUF3865)